jgi:low molecular weight protein-tyrosine phosphatase
MIDTTNNISVLFVCMGNICRSPTVEAVFRQIAERDAPALKLTVDSAGTHDYHVGEPPDPRSQAAARRRGLDLTPLRARQLEAADFERFDFVLVMDERNLADARAIAPREFRARLQLFLEYAPELEFRDLPDPYYGGAAGFEQVLDLAEAASRGLLEALRARAAAR